ncbi:hypothetical protein DRO47_03345 [Candidatus Bathyarchaeota archaeon]|nr:MAG: hypothetical protein DRO47_03345 [Candidatus Bathyarchaeota archaeon]
MSTVTVRVPREIRELMKKYRNVNWSEVVRKAILKKIREESERNLAEAVLLNEKLRRKAPEGWDSVKVIRDWRRMR